LVAAGVELRLWNQTNTMHRKGGLYGSDIALVGSDNLDIRGQISSSESVVFSNDKSLIKQLNQEFDEDVKSTILVKEEDIKKFLKSSSRFHKFIGWLIKNQI